MKNRITFLILTMLLIVPTLAQARPLNIVCTIGQISDIVQTVGGKHVQVNGLMGAGVDPHLYRASEHDVRKLSEAEIIFYNGLNLEAKLGKILKQMQKRKTIVAVGESIPKNLLLDSTTYAGHPDPHIWFNVEHWLRVSQTIKDALINADPEHSKYYTQRFNALAEELKTLDQYVIRKANELPTDQRILVTAHDAFRYFGEKYQFTVVGLQGISTESQAGTKDVANLADFITEKKIKAIFIESSVPERNIRAVQEAVAARGWTVEIGGELFSDAMGDEGTAEGTYIGMVTHNINTIVNALK